MRGAKVIIIDAICWIIEVMELGDEGGDESMDAACDLSFWL